MYIERERERDKEVKKKNNNKNNEVKDRRMINGGKKTWCI